MSAIDTARYWAISGFGYGRGHTPGEAIENYVASQMRSIPAKSTIFGTKAKWETALRTGEAKADVWHAPEGVTGFVIDSRLHWITPDDNYLDPDMERELLDDTKNQPVNGR